MEQQRFAHASMPGPLGSERLANSAISIVDAERSTEYQFKAVEHRATRYHNIQIQKFVKTSTTSSIEF